MDRKQSQFTEVSTLLDSDFVPSFGLNTNKKVSKYNFFDQIKDELLTFYYQTIEQLQSANLVADPDDPIYVMVAETNFSIYKITSLAANPGDIELDNGATASLQNQQKNIVSSYADLASTPAIEAGYVVTTLGHTYIGIGSLSFIAKSGSVTDNGGTRINSATTGFYWEAIIDGAIDPLMFGATGDGVVNDLLKCQQMFAASIPLGYREFDFLGKSYYLGTISVHEASKFRFVRIDGIKIFGMPKMLATNAFVTQDIRYESVFEFVDCSDVYVECHAVSTIDMAAQQPSGLIDVNLVSDTVNASNVYVKAYLKGGVAPFHTVNSWGFRKRTGADPIYSNIRFDLTADSVKYGTRMIGCGFNVVGNINTTLATRSYFNVGCSNHEITVNSDRQRYITDVFIKAYRDNVDNVFVTFNQSGSTSTEEAFSIEHDNLEQDTTITNVTINANVIRRTGGNIGLIGAQYALGGPLQTTTNSITDGITINYQGNPVIAAATLRFPTKPNTPGVIRVSRNFEPFGFTTNGFSLAIGDSICAVAAGTNDAILKFEGVTSSDGAALVKVYCTDDYTNIPSLNRISALYWVTFYKLTAGAGVVVNSTVIASNTIGTPPVITFSIANNALMVESNQAGANSRLSASMSHIGSRFV